MRKGECAEERTGGEGRGGAGRGGAGRCEAGVVLFHGKRRRVVRLWRTIVARRRGKSGVEVSRVREGKQFVCQNNALLLMNENWISRQEEIMVPYTKAFKTKQSETTLFKCFWYDYIRGTQLPNLSGNSEMRSSLILSLSGPKTITGRVCCNSCWTTASYDRMLSSARAL